MAFFWTSVFIVMVFWRPQEWLFPWMFGWPVLDVVVGISALALSIEVNEGRTTIPKILPQLKLLIGLWIAAPLSHIPHGYFFGFKEAIMPVFKICFFSYLLVCVLDRPTRLRTTALLFVGMGLTIAYHAFMQLERGYGFGPVLPYWIEPIDLEPGYYRTCFYGIFNDPNDLAQLFVVCIPFCFALGKRLNIFSFLIGSGLTYYFVKALDTTHSRGGEVGLVAALGTQIALLLPHRWFPYLMFAGFIGFLGICPFSESMLDASAHDRVVYWGLANQMFKHNPIFGIGYDMSWQVTLRGEALHNAFVTCYTELGLFGYWFWFLLIQLGIIGAWRARGALRRVADPNAKWIRHLAGMTIVSTMGFCASAYFLSRTFVFPLFFLVAMLAAMPRMAAQYIPPNYPPLFNLRRDVYKWGTIGSLISVIYIYISCILLNMAYYG